MLCPPPLSCYTYMKNFTFFILNMIRPICIILGILIYKGLLNTVSTFPTPQSVLQRSSKENNSANLIITVVIKILILFVRVIVLFLYLRIASIFSLLIYFHHQLLNILVFTAFFKPPCIHPLSFNNVQGRESIRMILLLF